MAVGRPRRILMAGFKHETNTFSKVPATLDSFRSRVLLYGPDVAKHFQHTKSEMAAFLDAASKNDWQSVLPIYADATPSGKVTEDTFDHVVSTILNAISDEGPIDGVMLALHGAMVCSHTDDGDGELLSRLRAVVGPHCPIAVTLDLHANISDAMARFSTIIVPYRTYPHVDQYDIASEAADLLRRTMNGEIRPVCRVHRGALLDGIDHGRTSLPGPMTEILASAGAMMSSAGVLSIGIAAGFPWADTRDAGPSVVIVSDGICPSHLALAGQLTEHIWQSRGRHTIQTVPVGAAMAAISSAPASDFPLLLADFADNPGGGGYGDSTVLLQAMIEGGVQNAAFGMIYDPLAVQTCIAQGLGGQVVVAIGGKTDPQYGKPLPVTGRVIAVTDGRLRLQGPMMAGVPINMGPTVVLQVEGIEIILTSGRFQCYDRMFFEHARIDLARKSVVAVKSAHHFRAAFGPLAGRVILVDSEAGLTARNFRNLDYRNVRRPICPLDKI